MNIVQRSPKIFKVKLLKIGSKNEYHFCNVKLCIRAHKAKYSLQLTDHLLLMQSANFWYSFTF